MKCPYCGGDAQLVTGDKVYPRRPDLAKLNFWMCEPCDAYVGCHRAGHGPAPQDGTVALGRLANAELRSAKTAAHFEFDELWQSRRMTRSEAYAWLAGRMGIPVEECHIGNFDVDQCTTVVYVCMELDGKEG